MAALDPTDAPSFRPPFIPTEPLGRWTTWALIATVVVAWVSAGVDLHQLSLLGGDAARDDVPGRARAAWDQARQVVLSIRAGLLVAVGATFLTWLWQARVNLRAMGVRRLRWSRHWVVTGFAIPIVNLFRPYQVVREVWQASVPENLDPFNWRTLPLPPLLGLWWGGFVAWLLLETLALLLGLTDEVHLRKLQLVAAVRMLADVAAAVAAFLTIFLVGRIDDAQARKRARQREEQASGGVFASAHLPAG